MKYVIDVDRIKAINADTDLDSIQEYLDAWEQVCHGEPKGGKIGSLEIRMRFRWLTASRSTIIQSSEVHPGLTNDIEKELDRLFENFVL